MASNATYYYTINTWQKDTQKRRDKRHWGTREYLEDTTEKENNKWIDELRYVGDNVLSASPHWHRETSIFDTTPEPNVHRSSPPIYAFSVLSPRQRSF
ncbi:hypothetical protein NPIL_680291 [Nephila pilipes]|uniref:Uncharacterized protein n=1 Tax=Nephila pilipes TaxID=299642 RepID=A0A8X6UVG5_NEPPI|nr:hypothetical protein NPIL_680291 [Nephila pilipes]